MKVLLLEKVKNLGSMGDLVNVKGGFARNYLFVKKKALRFNKENQEVFQNQKKLIEEANNDRKKLASENSSLLLRKTVTIIRQAGDDGQLYGSVNNKDIANSLALQFKIEVLTENLVLDKKIKEVGLYNVRAYLHPEIEAVRFNVNVARSLEEAKNALEDNTLEVVPHSDFESTKVPKKSPLTHHNLSKQSKI